MTKSLTDSEKETIKKISSLPIEEVLIDEIRSDGKNPNQMSAEMFSGLVAHISDHGIINAIIITEDGLIADGEHRVLAAKELGLKTIKARRIKNDEALRRTVRQTMNKIHGTHDANLDAEEFKALIEMDAIIPLSKYLGEDCGSMLSVLDRVEKESEKDPDNYDLEEAVSQVPADPVTKPGDVIRMGDHVLICGDATDPKVWDKLLDGSGAAMMMTDPPYNCHIEGKGDHGQKMTLMNDNISRDAFHTLLLNFLKCAMKHVVGAQYVFMSSEMWPLLHTTFEEAGGKWSTTIIWVKSHFVLSRKDYHPQYEPIMVGTVKKKLNSKMKTSAQPILYGWRKKDSSRKWYDTRTETDVWVAPKPNRNEQHPTMKPVTLYRKAIVLSSTPMDTVVDPFCGSGSAVIACEQTHRFCRAIELSPEYCDIIVERWEKLTNKKSELMHSG